jgi:hypothetical protein
MWEDIVKHYEFIEGAQMSNSFILLMTLDGSKEPFSTTQISEIIANQSKGKIFKAAGALKDSLENRLRKNGYVAGNDIPNVKRNHKPIRMTLHTIHRREVNIDCIASFLSTFESNKILE